MWESGVEREQPVSLLIQEKWEMWRSELPALTAKLAPLCYYAKDARIVSVQLHGF